MMRNVGFGCHGYNGLRVLLHASMCLLRFTLTLHPILCCTTVTVMMCRDGFTYDGCVMSIFGCYVTQSICRRTKKGGIGWMGYCASRVLYLESSAALYYGMSQMAQGPAHCFLILLPRRKQDTLYKRGYCATWST